MTQSSGIARFGPGERFALLRTLGAGGSGVVLHARDRTGEEVALKLLRDTGADALLGFKREFRTLADLIHPNVVTLYELLSIDDGWYISMQYVDGVAFTEWVRPGFAPSPQLTWTPEADEQVDSVPEATGSLDVARLRSAMRQLAIGLTAIHNAGIVHGDVKPSNMLITPEGRLVILDFGLALAMGAAPGRPRVGTPAYMAPEQLEEPATRASDWYAVGTVLFEALTGTRPYAGNTSHVLAQKRAYPAPHPGDQQPGLPADLCALCTALLQIDPAARPTGPEVLAALDVDGQTKEYVAPPFVGRSEELDQLDRWLAEVEEAGVTRAAVVAGRSGIGKTALVQRFARAAIQRNPATTVLSGRCYQQEVLPFKGVDALVDALAEVLSARPRMREDLPDDLPLLARIFPVLQAYAVKDAATAELSQHEFRRRAGECLAELLRRIAEEGPLIVVIDDAQWGDADSASLLDQVLSARRPPPMLLLLTCRDQALDEAELVATVVELAERIDTLSCTTLQVGGLDERESRELAAALPGSQHLAQTLEEAGGHPYLLQKMLQAMADPEFRVAPTLVQIIEHQVARLDPDARRCLELICAAGFPISRSVLRTAASTALGEQQVITRLRAEQLIRTERLRDDEVFAPYHDRIRETVTEQLGDALPAAHQDLAEAMEALQWGTLPQRLSQWVGARDSERVRVVAVQAALEAQEAMAWNQGAQLWQMAIDAQSTDPRVYVGLAECLGNSGGSREAAEAYLVAAAHAPDQSALYRWKAVEQMMLSGWYHRGLKLFEEVFAEVGLPVSTWTPAVMLRSAWHMLMLWMRGREPAPAHPLTDHQRLQLTVLSGASSLATLDVNLSYEIQHRMLRRALDTGDVDWCVQGLTWETNHLSARGQRAQAERNLHQLAAMVADRPTALNRGRERLALAMYHYFHGEYFEALPLIREADDILRRECQDVSMELQLASQHEATSMLFLGLHDAFADKLPRRIREANERADLYLLSFYRYADASFLMLNQDRPDEARRELAAAMADVPTVDNTIYLLLDVLGAQRIEQYRGRAAEAFQRVEDGWPRLQRSGFLSVFSVGVFCRFARSSAALAAVRTRPGDRRERHWRSTIRADIRWILRLDNAWGRAHGLLLKAGYAGLTEDPSAIDALRTAHAALDACHLNLMANCVLWRLGEQQRDPKTMQRAASWLEDHASVVDVPRLAELYTPGWPSPH